MPQTRQPRKAKRTRRSYSEEFKQDAVQMLLDGHSAPSVAERLGLSGPNMLYNWKKQAVQRAGPAARSLGDRVAQLEDDHRRDQPEPYNLKKP
jgi:transposase-like protein